jgi:hypothetical protein
MRGAGFFSRFPKDLARVMFRSVFDETTRVMLVCATLPDKAIVPYLKAKLNVVKTLNWFDSALAQGKIMFTIVSWALRVNIATVTCDNLRRACQHGDLTFYIKTAMCRGGWSDMYSDMGGSKVTKNFACIVNYFRDKLRFGTADLTIHNFCKECLWGMLRNLLSTSQIQFRMHALHSVWPEVGLKTIFTLEMVLEYDRVDFYKDVIDNPNTFSAFSKVRSVQMLECVMKHGASLPVDESLKWAAQYSGDMLEWVVNHVSFIPNWTNVFIELFSWRNVEGCSKWCQIYGRKVPDLFDLMPGGYKEIIYTLGNEHGVKMVAEYCNPKDIADIALVLLREKRIEPAVQLLTLRPDVTICQTVDKLYDLLSHRWNESDWKKYFVRVRTACKLPKKSVKELLQKRATKFRKIDE